MSDKFARRAASNMLSKMANIAWRMPPMPFGALISAWLVGSLGSLHCVAMCSGFMVAMARRDNSVTAATAPLLPMRTIVRQQLAYHVGRLTTYMLFGAAFGTAGGIVLETAQLLPIQRAMYVIANLFLLLLGLSLATRTAGIPWLQRVGVRAFGAAFPALRPLLRRSWLAGCLALGVVWGMVPCALVYSVLPLALFAGGRWQGAAVMLAFGLGTLPNLAAIGLLLGHARPWLQHAAVRVVAALLLLAFAGVGIYRAVLYQAISCMGRFA